MTCIKITFLGLDYMIMTLEVSRFLKLRMKTSFYHNEIYQQEKEGIETPALKWTLELHPLQPMLK